MVKKTQKDECSNEKESIKLLVEKAIEKRLVNYNYKLVHAKMMKKQSEGMKYTLDDAINDHVDKIVSDMLKSELKEDMLKNVVASSYGINVDELPSILKSMILPKIKKLTPRPKPKPSSEIKSKTADKPKTQVEIFEELGLNRPVKHSEYLGVIPAIAGESRKDVIKKASEKFPEFEIDEDQFLTTTIADKKVWVVFGIKK